MGPAWVLTWLSSWPWNMVFRTLRTCLESFLCVMGMTMRVRVCLRLGPKPPSASSSCCTLSSSSQRNSCASCWSQPRNAGITFHTECSMANGETSVQRPDHITRNRVCSSWHKETYTYNTKHIHTEGTGRVQDVLVSRLDMTSPGWLLVKSQTCTH